MTLPLNVDANLRDRITPGMAKMEKSVKSTARSFGSLRLGATGLHSAFGLVARGAALAAGLAGVGGLAYGLKTMYHEAREAERATGITNAVIKSTGGVAHVSAKQVTDLAVAISNKVGVDDEAIQAGENMILTFKGIRNEAGKGNDIFNQTAQVVTDMSAALHGGDVSADSLRKTAIQVGKALQDPIKGSTQLARAGVVLSDSQKKQIKTLVEHGKKLEAQKIILGELRSEFGGTAAASTNAMEKLGVIFKNVAEQIGTAVLPVIDKVATWLGEHLPGAVDTATRVLGELGAAIKAGVAGEIPTTGGIFRWIAIASSTVTDFIGWVKTNAGKIQVAVRAGLAGDIPTTGGVFAWIATTTKAVQDFAAWVRDTGIPAIADEFTKLKIDLTPVAKKFVESAKSWGADLITGVKQGLSTGDWSGLGAVVGQGVISAITGAGDLLGKIASKIGDLLGKVDWFKVGSAVGKTAIPFLVGFVNELTTGLFTVAREHPFDTFLFVVGFLGLGKIGGIISKILAKIPFLRVFAPLFEGISKITKPINDAIGRVLSAMGKAFLRGLGLENVKMGRNLIRVFDGLRLRIMYFMEGFGKAGLAIIEAAGRGIRRGILFLGRVFAEVVGVIGRFLARLLGPVAAPFLRAGQVLLDRLGAGIRSRYGAISGFISRTISLLTTPFRAAGRWLINAGLDIVGGLFSGMRSAMAVVGRILSDIKSAIVGGLKRLFHLASPSRVMADLGRNIITGLIKGMLTTSGALAKTVQSIGGTVANIFGDLFSPSHLNFPGTGGVPGFSGGSIQALVKSYAQNLYGWSGAQWDALFHLIMGESGFNPNAQNPTSTAYGIFQFLNSTWASVGARKTSDPAGQTIAGLRYIAQAYGSPINAYSKWLSRSPHWYGGGLAPTVFDRPTLIGVGERGPETVSVTRGSGGGSVGFTPADLRRALEGMAMELRDPLGNTIAGQLVVRAQRGSR